MVYFVLDPAASAIKIGYSAKSMKRLPGLQTGNSTELQLLGEIPGTRQRESELHERFLSLRVRGEWFRFEQDLPETISALLAANGALVHPFEVRCYVVFTGLLRNHGETAFSRQRDSSRADALDNMAFWLARFAGPEGMQRVFDGVEAFAYRHLPERAAYAMQCLDHRFDGNGGWYA